MLTACSRKLTRMFAGFGKGAEAGESVCPLNAKVKLRMSLGLAAWRSILRVRGYTCCIGLIAAALREEWRQVQKSKQRKGEARIFRLPHSRMWIYIITCAYTHTHNVSCCVAHIKRSGVVLQLA